MRLIFPRRPVLADFLRSVNLLVMYQLATANPFCSNPSRQSFNLDETVNLDLNVISLRRIE
jgi:hypothetical protein